MARMMLTAALMGLLLAPGCASPDKDQGSGDGSEAEAEGDTDEEIPGEQGPSWYADVKPLMESHCVACHQAGAVGAFSLDTLDAVSIVSEYVADAVQDRRMPPWLAEDGCEEYRDDIQLTEEEIDTILEWIDNGKPEGDIQLAKTGEPMNEGGLERVDFTLELPVRYTPDATDDDDYRCFPIPWPLDDEAYVTGFVVNPDQADLVHHVIAYVAGAGYADALQAEEAEDGLPGYSCFGGPGVISQADADWLGAWAPGAVQGNFPNGVGIRMAPGSWVILQVHYNLLAGASVADQTSIDFQVEVEAERSGWIQPFANPAWVMTGGMDIPAQTQGVRHRFDYTMLMDLDIHSANLHMHRLGTRASMTLTKTDGTEDCLVQIDDWDFDWQRSYVFQDMKTLGVGDVWSLECEWDNPTDENVDWGEGTGDEMCLGSVLMSLP